MTRVVVIGGGDSDLAARLKALCIETVLTSVDLHSIADVLAGPAMTFRLDEVVEAHMKRGGVPKFGSDRPYLKKKKGRS